MQTSILKITANQIICNERFQVRDGLNQSLVTDYIQAYRDGADMPPLTVWKNSDDGNYYLLDGFHRYAALTSTALGVNEIVVIVKGGNQSEARRIAAQSNMRNGLRLTIGERRRAVKIYLDEVGELYSDTQIAAELHLTRQTVATIRKELGYRNRQERVGQAIEEYKVENPGASNREVADKIGISEKGVRRSVKILQSAAPSHTLIAHKKNQSKEFEQKKTIIVIPKDDAGRDIPPDLITVWNGARDTVCELKSLISKAKCLLEKNINAQAKPFKGISSVAVSSLERAYNSVASRMPYAVCTCGGFGCKKCGGNGLLSEEQWKLFVRDEEK